MAATPQTPPPQPPDERFWVKYSPNHELPVSGAASLLWHAGAVVALVVIGFVVAWNRPAEMPIEGVEIGGGGSPQGVVGGPGVGSPTGLVDAASPRDLPADAVLPKTALSDIRNIPITPADILKDLAVDSDATRDVASLIERGTQSLAKLAKIDGALRDSLLGQGHGGPGSGGGVGDGKGPNVGGGTGNGKLDVRTKRKLRWTIMFNTQSGNDYLKQLNVLGAILSFQGADGGLRIVHDLAKHPVAVERATEEDRQKLNRIFWIDDNRESVDQLMRAMGRDESPPQIVALFPLHFETELLDKELKFHNRAEDAIVETRFQILMRGGRYDIIVVDQRYK